MMRYGTMVIMLALSWQLLGAQQPQPLLQFSLLGGTGYTAFSATVRNFERIIECGAYRSGGGWNPTGRFSVAYPWTPTLSLALGISYQDYSGTMETQGRYSYRDPQTQTLRTAQVTNTLETTWRYLSLLPSIRYRALQTLPQGWLSVAAGLQVGIPLEATYEQRQRFDPNSPLVFIVNGRRMKERQLATGAIQSKQPVLLHSIVELEHHLALSESWSVLQTLTLAIPWNSLSTAAPWKAMHLGILAGIGYTLFPAPPVKIPKLPIKPVAPHPIAPMPKATLALHLSEDAHLNVGNELIATLPIVNAVFFDQNSATIPPRYIQQRVPKAVIDTISDAIRYHRYLLPVLAAIAQHNPNATFEIVGATSGVEDEPAGIVLARRRAEAVAAALQRLGVSRARLQVRWQLLPDYPSNPAFPEGRAENRRVDIFVHNAPLLRYVETQRFRELEGTLQAEGEIANVDLHQSPAQLRILPPLDTAATITLAKFALPFPFRRRLPLHTATATFIGQLQIPHPSRSLQVWDTLTVALNSLPQIETELRLDHFEAILRFDYNSSQLSAANQQLLQQLVELLPEGSTIVVYGSSDTLGTEQRNRILAQERADHVTQYLQSIAPGSYHFIAERYRGKKFDERLPEGRFLNRSIRLRVRARNEERQSN